MFRQPRDQRGQGGAVVDEGGADDEVIACRVVSSRNDDRDRPLGSRGRRTRMSGHGFAGVETSANAGARHSDWVSLAPGTWVIRATRRQRSDARAAWRIVEGAARESAG
jgi:hypothetical protein